MMDVKVVLFRSKDDCSETLALTLPQTATVRKLRDRVTELQAPPLMCVAILQDGKRCGDEELVSAVSEDGKGLVAFLRNGKSKEQKKKSTSESQASQAVTQPQQADPKTVSALILSWLTNDVGLELMAAAPLVRGFADLGVVSEAELWALDQGQIKGCVSHGGQRKKILAALQRGKVEPKAAKKRRGAFDDASEPEEAVEPPAERKPQACTGVVLINRSPVMILWAAILAKEALGYDWAEALSLGSAVSALNARAKHDRIWGTKHSSAAASFGGEGAPVDDVQLLGRPVPACRTAAGIRGLVSEQAVQPRSVAKSLRLAFAGHALETVYSAMLSLARIAAQVSRAPVPAVPRA